MKTKFKISILFLTVLLVGMVIGALINGAIIKNRMDNIMKLRGKGGYGTFIEQIIKPDDSQREQLRETIDKYSTTLFELRARSRNEMIAVMDSMRTEISPLLTDEQIDRLQRPIRPEIMNPMRRPKPGREIPPKRK